MDSDISKNITRLANRIVNLLVEKTNGDLRSPIPFLFSYEQGHFINRSSSESKFGKSNKQIRQYVIDHLLKNELIFISPGNIKLVYLTQKAID
ncbi:MAG TPA: hypothetical protein VF084_13785, partial [Nitrososphaeraceae archaeon]